MAWTDEQGRMRHCFERSFNDIPRRRGAALGLNGGEQEQAEGWMRDFRGAMLDICDTDTVQIIEGEMGRLAPLTRDPLAASRSSSLEELIKLRLLEEFREQIQSALSQDTRDA